MPDFICDVVDAHSRAVIDDERFTADDDDALRARLAALPLPDGMCWGDLRSATTRLFAFGVVFIVDGNDATDAIERTMADFLSGDLPDGISFEHVAGPFEFRAELHEQVEAPVVVAGTRSTIARAIEDGER